MYCESCCGPAYAIKCRWCGDWFIVCVKHYRGHRYCGDDCRRLARRVQARKAQQTYLDKLKGKRSRAKASSEYRARKAKGLPPRGRVKTVIDQALCTRPPKAQYPAPQLGKCVVCGSLCRVIALRQ